MKNSILFIAATLFIFNVNLYSQEQIDVKSISISQDSIGNTRISIIANNSSNQQVSYGGESITPYYSYATAFSCNPCNIPSVFPSTGFDDLGFRANMGQVSGQIVVTFASPVISDQIVLRPTLQRKKRNFTVRGNTTMLIKKIEITNAFNSTIIDAVDNDVMLNGGFIATFWQNSTDFSRRKAGFQGIVFTFDEPRN